MKRRRPLGVRAYLVAAMVALALTTVAATALVVNRAVDVELGRLADQDLALSAQDAAETAAEMYLDGGGLTTGAQDALHVVGHGEGGGIAILGVHERPILGLPAVGAPGESRAAVVVNGRLVGTVTATRRRHGRIDGAVRRLDRDLRGRMDGLLLQAGTIAGLVALLLAMLVAFRMARPLERLTDVARRMEAGHIEARATGSGGGREMSRLAHTMDRLAAALRRQEEVRRATAADVTHELRNALVGVVARIEVLKEGIADDPHEMVLRMERDARRMHRLIDDVDLLVDAQRPSLLVESQPIDLADIVRIAVERHERAGRSRSITMSASVVPAQVHGDPARLAQVVDNLLSNAVRYTDPGGSVAVRVIPCGAEVAIEVADTGIGIPAEQVARVFDRFWRASGASERVPEGSGVGLAVVSEIVRGHGGRVDVTSRPGSGSTFTVSLPLGETPSAGTAPVAAQPAPGAPALARSA